MYEEYYGFTEKPFSLTPDPKYLFRSHSHGSAFDLLQYAIRRREGFVVITGDIGTGKTTTCRALLEQIDRKTFTALVLNPFLSEEDLLKLILQDFGVVSREDVKRGRLAHVSKQDLIDTLYDFLLGLLPLHASAVVIIDEAQNLPLQVLEQIRILSNLETDKEKLLQIVLVGQLNLHTMLRSPQLRQLDQRVSIRYELKPLTREEVASYVMHRLMIAGGAPSVSFTPKALVQVHRLSGGVPRLINLICDRALLAGYSERTSRITPEMVRKAAESLELRLPRTRRFEWARRRASLFLGLTAVGVSALLGAGVAVFAVQKITQPAHVAAAAAASAPPRRVSAPATPAESPDATPIADAMAVAAAPAPEAADRGLPEGTAYTILVGSFPVESQDGVPGTASAPARQLARQLESLGLPVYYAEVEIEGRGRWQRVLAGAYAGPDEARADEARLHERRELSGVRVVGAAFATAGAVSPRPGPNGLRARQGFDD